MEIQEYLDQQEKIYNSLYQFLDDQDESDINLKKIIEILEMNNIDSNSEKFNDILQILARIAAQHYRHQYFIERVGSLLIFLKDKIKQTYSNIEIYKLFKKSIYLLKFLIQNKIIEFDHSFTNFLVDNIDNDYLVLQFAVFMYPDTKNLLDDYKIATIENYLLDIDSNIFDNIEQIKQSGENSSCICKLIRDDSIIDFISHVTHKNLNLSSEIKDSIFESNLLLINQNTTLIEYAAFFGSIQIFQYLLFNGVKLQPSLWIYAIHGNNPDIIHLLEENKVELPNKSYEECLKESIKCHHNQIADYFLNNFIEFSIDSNYLENNFFKNILNYSFHYHNFAFMKKYFNLQMSFFYSCKYNYINLVKLLLKSNEIDINAIIISFKMI